jgi:hypothetical protein
MVCYGQASKRSHRYFGHHVVVQIQIPDGDVFECPISTGKQQLR